MDEEKLLRNTLGQCLPEEERKQKSQILGNNNQKKKSEGIEQIWTGWIWKNEEEKYIFMSKAKCKHFNSIYQYNNNY